MVNRIVATQLLLTSGLHRCQQRIFKKNTNYLYAVRISISYFFLKFSFKSVLPINYARKC